MATAEQFSLRWNNFQSNMTSGFHALWEGEDLVDVTLAADGRFLQAHKVVLSVCSPYFKTLFKVNPCKHPIVILKDVGYKDLEALLQFMYRGEVNVCQEELGGFLKTAEMLEVKGLTGEDSQRSSSPSSQSQQSQSKPLKERPQPHLSGKVVSAAMVLSDDSRSVSTSQFKRKRVSGPVSPPASNTVSNDDAQSSRDYAELSHPKQEPRDHESEEGGDAYNTDKDANDSLVSLLSGEGSHGGMHSDSVQGMEQTMFSSITGHGPGDSGGSQDSSQGLLNIFHVNSGGGFGALPGFGSLGMNIGSISSKRTKIQCPYCDGMYSNSSNLRVHIKDVHDPATSSLPVLCVSCNLTFKNQSSLRYHRWKYHGGGRCSQSSASTERTGARGSGVSTSGIGGFESGLAADISVQFSGVSRHPETGGLRSGQKSGKGGPMKKESGEGRGEGEWGGQEVSQENYGGTPTSLGPSLQSSSPKALGASGTFQS